ncbi:hypothetical protein [Phocaeicola plebeius]|uniref:hypothetical protein n=1 Tax=Phocaeicola plebeius TaxID=310297 RepID=UPI00266D6004|nr:hypothetical protein [Phocaeicola plebeius]
MKFIASKGTEIEQADSPDLYAFALSFFKLLPSISQDMGFLLKMLAIPNDAVCILFWHICRSICMRI